MSTTVFWMSYETRLPQFLKENPALHVIYTLKVTIFASDGKKKKKKKSVRLFFPLECLWKRLRAFPPLKSGMKGPDGKGEGRRGAAHL